MATAARDLYYERNSVYGSLAYDLDREVRERELRHAGEERRESTAPAVHPETKVHAVEQPKVRQQERLSLLTVLGFFAVVAMAVIVLFSYVKLTALSSDVVALKNELSVLRTSHVTLNAEYQQMYDLSTVKEVAEAAGMVKPGNSQIYYVDLSGGDNAVVYQQQESGVMTQLLASLHHGVYAVVEYFE